MKKIDILCVLYVFSTVAIYAQNSDTALLKDISYSIPNNFYIIDYAIGNFISKEETSIIIFCDAVKNKKVFKAPIGIYRWDAPSAETPLMIKWIAKVANPELFNDYNIRKDIKDFYLEFFNYKLTDEQLNFILNSKVNKGLNL